MSNSCYVKVEGTKAFLYQHWDSDPETMVPFLKQFYNTFLSTRGFADPAYTLAQLIRHIGIKDRESKDYYMLPYSTGFGIYVEDSHYPANDGHTYVLKLNGTITYNGLVV